MADDRHEFGGPWTELKLDAIDAYAHFFTQALKKQEFELWYIDGFAGTGTRISKREVGGLLEGGPTAVEEEVLAGSARRALLVEPPFHHLVLLDEDPAHFRALCSLAKEFRGRDIRPLKGDANERIREILEAPPWTGPRAWAQRALVFLDPYGMTVRWPTLEMLAATERADVWYLVNLKGLFSSWPAITQLSILRSADRSPSSSGPMRGRPNSTGSRRQAATSSVQPPGRAAIEPLHERKCPPSTASVLGRSSGTYPRPLA